MCGMERIATDTYSFADLRNGGFVYVDKTAILKTLADDSRGRHFFIARPRRFGKSLAVSTLKSLTVEDNELDAYEPERIKPVTLLFQTGYLTIKGFEQIEAIRRYTLGFPNMEVENSFLKDLSAVYVGKETSDAVNVAAEGVFQ